MTPAPKPDLEPQHALFAARNRFLACFVDVDARDLERLAVALEKLPREDLARVARYAEALAEWPSDPVGSTDGPGEE